PAADGGGPLLVSAAISLKEPFEDLARMLAAGRSPLRAALNFGASGDLARQVEAGAPVDVIATADEATMQRLAEQGLLAPPVVIDTAEGSSAPSVRYPIAVVKSSAHLADARRFVENAASPTGRRLLARRGFLPPQP